jgi:phage tail sheath protein FI
MPEYLAPGVYVEEIDTGNKPIEGVSTSTAGMIGVTERGPVNVPILITGMGEYNRWFGGQLNIADYFDAATGHHCYLPHAVEGFFTNVGKRVYITRVLNEAGATRSHFDLHDRGDDNSAFSWLLRGAREGHGTIYVVSIDLPKPGALSEKNRVRIGGGSDAEYRDTVTVGKASATIHVPLDFPLSRMHSEASDIKNIKRVKTSTPNAFTLSDAARAGNESVVLAGSVVDLNALAVNDLLEIGPQFASEHRFIRAIETTMVSGSKGTRRVQLDSPLMMSYPVLPTTNVARLESNPPNAADNVEASTLGAAASTGDRVVFLNAHPVNFTERDELVIFETGDNDRREVRRIGNLSLLKLSMGTYGSYPASSVVEGVAITNAADSAKKLMAPIVSGATVITLDNRDGLAPGTVIRIGNSPDEEYATIAALPNPSPGNAPPNPGNVVLTHSLHIARPSASPGTQVQRQVITPPPNIKPATAVVLDSEPSSTELIISDGGTLAAGKNRYNANDFICVTTSTGQVSYHRLTTDFTTLNARPVTLSIPLAVPHALGSPVAERTKLLEVHALDAGIWGNRLRLSVQDEPTGLVTETSFTNIGSATQGRLLSITGVESGSLLEIYDKNTNTPVDNPVKVATVNRATNEISIDAPGLTAAQMAPGLRVRSREFRLTVYLLRQLDPAMPTRNETVLDSEVFRHLSMDHRHSRYVHKIIGTTWDTSPGTTTDRDHRPLRREDRRSEGESHLIRVRDLAQNLHEGLPDLPPYRIPTLESFRPGPESLVDVLPDGRRLPARHPLTEGNDSLMTLNDKIYIGQDHPTPENRTGLQSLRNIEEISIVACPGRTSSTIQNALINHCELMRYRFAVLDGPRPPNDSLADVQFQRQQFDTKYAALYHPWLLVPDPYPTSLARIADYPIPPSGHMLGVYARTDIERGVHKAPANEVVRGILGLQRILNKEQHDILNPYPVNINVIRDFRNNNRGIRVYGGRVITSDSDWKYVNVRRLLILIEKSIDMGLQWVVFEPNAEPLWARVRRSIANFLTLVWRNGGLEGTKVEEAYFVKCDRTTMTQADIDSGRLIVVIGVAPVKPAEYVIVRIGLWTAHADD